MRLYCRNVWEFVDSLKNIYRFIEFDCTIEAENSNLFSVNVDVSRTSQLCNVVYNVVAS